MKIRKLTIRDIGRFNRGNRITINFDNLNDAKLIAVIGGNGAGKTTMLESIPGALLREMPSRGAIARMTNSNRGLIELGIETDQEYNCQLHVNGANKTPKTSAYVYDEAGNALNDGKATTYDATIAKLFPSKEVLLSSVFAAQSGKGRFLDMLPAQRKELFAQMLGLQKLQEMADLSRGEADVIRKKLGKLGLRSGLLQNVACDVMFLATSLIKAKTGLDELRENILQQQNSVENARQKMEKYRELGATLSRATLQARHDEKFAKSELEKHDKDIHAEYASLAKLKAEYGTIIQRLESVPVLKQTALQKNDARLATDRYSIELSELRKEQGIYQTTYKTWVDEGLALRTEVNARDTDHKLNTQAQMQRVAGLKRRSEQTSHAVSMLDNVPCGGTGEYSSCPLISAATEAQSGASTLAEDLGNAKKAMMAMKDEPKKLVSLRVELTELRKLSPTKPDSNRIFEIESDLEASRKILHEADIATTTLAALQDAAKRSHILQASMAKMSDDIEIASKSRYELFDKLTAAKDAAEIANESEKNHVKMRPEQPGRSHLLELQSQEMTAVAMIATLTEREAKAKKASVDLTEIKAQSSILASGLDDWEHLHRAFGSTGIQALEIDAAGPEVSDLTNDLLHACYGSRFSAKLETTALKADGKGTKEVFDLRVIDTERGTDGSADRLSGGEKVLVSEALSLAIAIYNTRRSEMPMLDLFRDECAGALSSENAQLYIEMLRKALDVGGFHRCYFVAHQPRLWGLADSLIEVKDGDIKIVNR